MNAVLRLPPCSQLIPMDLGESQGDDPAYSHSLNILPCPSKSLLTLHIQPPYTAEQLVGHLPSLSPSSPKTAAAETFPVLFSQDWESHM